VMELVDRNKGPYFRLITTFKDYSESDGISDEGATVHAVDIYKGRKAGCLTPRGSVKCR